jgi:hypothetical protein
MLSTKRGLGPAVGRFFHSFDSGGQMKWQGHILTANGPERWEVELFSWLTGEPNGTETIPVSEMKDWAFYATNQDMLTASGERRDLGCAVHEIRYDVRRRRTGTLLMPENNCCDMRGCIKLFEAIATDVDRIYTFVGGEPDTVYFKKSNKWEAGRYVIYIT